MDEKREFIREALATDQGYIVRKDEQISRNFIHQAALCLTYPDAIFSIEWLMDNCEIEYEEAYSIIKKYKEMDYFDFQCSCKTNQAFLNEKIELMISTALKLQQTYNKYLNETRTK